MLIFFLLKIWIFKEPYLVRQLARSNRGFISVKLIASMKKMRKLTRSLHVSLFFHAGVKAKFVQIFVLSFNTCRLFRLKCREFCLTCQIYFDNIWSDKESTQFSTDECYTQKWCIQTFFHKSYKNTWNSKSRPCRLDCSRLFRKINFLSKTDSVT